MRCNTERSWCPMNLPSHRNWWNMLCKIEWAHLYLSSFFLVLKLNFQLHTSAWWYFLYLILKSSQEAPEGFKFGDQSNHILGMYKFLLMIIPVEETTNLFRTPKQAVDFWKLQNEALKLSAQLFKAGCWAAVKLCVYQYEQKNLSFHTG